MLFELQINLAKTVPASAPHDVAEALRLAASEIEHDGIPALKPGERSPVHRVWLRRLGAAIKVPIGWFQYHGSRRHLKDEHDARLRGAYAKFDA